MYVLENNLFGENKEKIALERLREFCPPEGYYVAFSGGKDSVVIKHLCERAGIKFDVHYALTTIDPPELVLFIKRKCPDVEIVRPERPMLQELEKRGFPTRWHRWCCEYLKEKNSTNRVTVTGVRREESARRRERPVVEMCERRGTTLVNPIVDWMTGEVWRYIRGYKIPYCSLYDEGWRRLGCVLCPMTSTDVAYLEMARWPKLAEAWRRAFIRLYDRRAAESKKCVAQWSSGDEMFNWWLTVGREGNPNRQPDCQDNLFL